MSDWFLSTGSKQATEVKKRERFMYIDKLFCINQFNMFRYHKHGKKKMLFEEVHLKKSVFKMSLTSLW